MRSILALGCLTLFGSSLAYAQERAPALVVQMPNPKGQTQLQPLALTHVETTVRIVGFVAEIKLTMTFANALDRQLEGELYFPIPAGSTVSGYALDVGGVLVDGVVVEKEKARVVFETEVRKGVDPGLVEWTQGNNFHTRVYPIPAHGTRTIAVRFVSNLELGPAGSTFHLPLAFKDKLTEFALTVDVAGSKQAPKVGWPGPSGMQFSNNGSRYTAQVKLQGKPVVGELSLFFAANDIESALVEKTPAGEMFFALHDAVPVPAVVAGKPAAAVSRINILWDASNSRANNDHNREMELIRRFFADHNQNRIDVDLTVLRNAVQSAQHFVIEKGNAEALLKVLREMVYDGGTQLGALSPAANGTVPNFYWLFSDGLTSFGKGEPSGFKAPVHAVSASGSVNNVFLTWLAESTGGLYTDLLKGSADTALAAIGNAPLSVIAVTPSHGTIEQVLPRPGKPVGNELLVTGKLSSPTATVRVDLGVAGKVTWSREYTLNAVRASSGDLLARLWAQAKVTVLAAFPKKNEQTLVALGKQYGLVTPGTSLLVLERLEQYVEHQIPPPAALTAMRAQYEALMAERTQAAQADEANKLERILSLWQERVEWWSTKFKYPQGFKYGEPARKHKAGRPRADADKEEDISAGAAAGKAMAAESMAAAPSASRSLAKDDADSDEKKSAKAVGSGASGEPSTPEPGIELKAWDPDTPYLRAIKGAAKADAFKVYLAQKQAYGGSPAFYLDCAEFFFNHGQKAVAIQVLSNIAELELEDAALLRVVAYRLQQAKELELAALLLEDVLRLRPEEPQSYRDLALVLADQRQYVRALELLAKVVMNQWDRFEGIELVALMEFNAIVPRAKAAGVRKLPLDPRLVKLLDLDVRISLGWDADLTDIDLWVIEPSGEKVAYDHQQSTIGGLVSTDFTQGYGPEEYVLRRAMPGDYVVKANFFGSSAQALQGAVTLRLELITNFGRPNEKRQSTTVRLTEAKDTFTVGTLKF